MDMMFFLETGLWQNLRLDIVSLGSRFMDGRGSTGNLKRVVPFAVGCNERQSQLQFMVEWGWMKKRLILKWDDIGRLVP